MGYKYIALESEYGSGGGQIARQTAEMCGIPLYGRRVLEIVSQRLHIPVETIEEREETITSSFLFSIYMLSQTSGGDSDALPLEDRIFLEAQDAIRGLSVLGPAVFLGHCAAHALEERSDVLRVFIRADRSLREKNIAARRGLSAREAAQELKRTDQKRANYFRAYTRKGWTDPENYDLILDSGTLGAKTCADMLFRVLSTDPKDV